MADRALRDATRRFCDRTACWRGGVVTADMTSGQAELSLTVPGCAEIVSIDFVELSGREIFPTTERKLSYCGPSWRTTAGDPTNYYTLMASGKIRLYPVPNRTLAGAITYELILKPALDGCDIPEFIADQYIEAVKAGALYELMRMPGQTWTNPEMASHYKAVFGEGVFDARDKTLRSYAAQNLDIQPGALF
jgi:hypothetical protein